ncbi:MAG: hypothetical protein D4R45_03380 [Planctomycetaceae bacterium]|nr:MAG: hypothetical protein D4R45_03380 [Planctomycetaceae bacterium]
MNIRQLTDKCIFLLLIFILQGIRSGSAGTRVSLPCKKETGRLYRPGDRSDRPAGIVNIYV